MNRERIVLDCLKKLLIDLQEDNVKFMNECLDRGWKETFNYAKGKVDHGLNILTYINMMEEEGDEDDSE